jgi:PAS domain S-box-containing protein
MGRARILIVEDEAIVAMDLQGRLAALGYEVAAVTSTGEEAVLRAHETRPDLALMDIRLAGELDGIAAAEQVRDRLGIPVVFLTAYADDDTLARAKVADPFGYLLKPFQDRDLRTTIEMALYKHKTDRDLRRLTRMYAVLSQVNQAIVRAVSRAEVLQQTARIIVEYGAYRLAWVAWKDGDKAIAVAAGGDTDGAVGRKGSFSLDDPEALGVVGASLKTGKTCVANDMAADPRYAVWRDTCARIGVRSAAAFPIRLKGDLCGALAVYCAEPDAFDREAVRLFEEVALDVSFALDWIESQEQRRKAETQLHATHRQTTAILESISDGFFSLDEELRITYFNAEAERLLGRSREEVMGREIFEAFPEAKGSVFELNYRRALRERVPVTFEVYFDVPPYRNWYDVKVYPQSKGISVYFLVTTEKKRAEEQLRFMSFCIERMGEPSYWVDEQGRFIYVNEAGCRDLGYAREELLAMTVPDIDPDMPATAWPQHWRELRERKSLLFEMRHRARDGRIFPVRVSANYVEFDGKGYNCAFVRDITEERRSQAALQALVESVVGHSGVESLHVLTSRLCAWMGVDAVLLSELQPDGLTLRTVSLQLDGAQRAEQQIPLRGTPCELAVQKGFAFCAGGVAAAFPGAALLEQGGFESYIGVPLHGRTGRPIGVLCALARKPMAPAPNARQVMEILAAKAATEIERLRADQERAALEAQLRQQQKLEAIGVLAGGVAHEVNNPITGVMNYAQLILDAAPAGSTEAKYAQEILREGERVTQIVRNLLTFARQDKQAHSPAELADIVESTLALVRTLMRHDRIRLDVALPAGLPRIICRSQQLRQVLLNLLTNARDALNERYPEADPDKVITLRATPFTRDGRRWVRLTVEDRGPGIPPEHLARIFDPFFTTKSGGTGLGLTISHGIVREHNGELHVESEPGRPTRFHVELPVDNGWRLTAPNKDDAEGTT